MAVPLVEAIRGLLLTEAGPGIAALTGLSPSKLLLRKTSVIKQFLPKLLRLGVSGRGALAMFQQAGLGVGKASYWGKGRLFRAALSVADAQEYITGLPHDEAVDFTQAHDMHMLMEDDYAVRVWGEWQDPITGEWKGKWITVGIEEGETLNDIEDRLYDSLSIWYAEGEFIEDIDWTVADLIHKI